MSRMPTGPQYALPPPGHPQHHQQHLPPPASGQTALYYPPPGTGPITHPQAHPPASHQYAQEPVYQTYNRPQSANNGRVTWNTGPDPGVASGSGYPPQPGPSRMTEGYPAYPQPHRSVSSTSNGRSHNAGWSSTHPNAAPSTSIPTRPDSSSRNAVKLEDLVSQERAQRPPTGRLTSGNGPGGLTSIPLSATQSTDNAKGGKDEGGGGGGQSGPSEFIKKLYRMLEDESSTYGKGKPSGAKRPQGAKRGPVGWSTGGASFVVWDMNDFTTKVLPQTFRHSNFSSFVRQLNKYGFSKIKHVDEDTGTIKDNVWEFQHANFQAGQKSDLDSIKRKTVAPKKGANAAGAAGNDDEATSPRGLMSEDVGRLNEMESRIASLEDQLSKAVDELQEARSREMSFANLLRDVIGHLSSIERGSSSSPRNSEPSPRIMHLYQQLDQVAGVSPRFIAPTFNQLPLPLPPQPQMMPYQPPPVRLAPVTGIPAHVSQTMIPPMSSIPGSVSTTLPPSHASPHTDAGSRSGDGPSPAGSSLSRQRGSISHLVQGQPADENVEIHPSNPPSSNPTSSEQTLYNGEPLEMTPIFAETPAWLNDTTSTPAMLPRGSIDGAALRGMMEALQTTAPTSGLRFEEAQDPLDMTKRQGQNQDSIAPDPALTSLPPNGDAAVAAAAGLNAVVEQSPFGTLVIPPGDQPAVQAPAEAPLRLRRSTVIKPHWTQTPRILVVEDDVVYRQLSSKFLEKFGCITETVEDAQGAVEKMNATKYDLVLMDIFFGPSMDGRKATSLIRQFDIYTPIISMTSNVQTQDVDSYLQSGMNDVLAKPFTKNGLFGILDKHLIHLKAIQLSAQVPRSLGLPPLSDQGVADAVATGAAQWGQGSTTTIVRNPLAAMGWSDETYSIVLQQFMATGSMPDANSLTDGSVNAANTLGTLNTMGGTGAIGTSVVFGDSSGFNRKRSIETVEDEWSPDPGSVAGSNGVAAPLMVNGMGMTMGATVFDPGMMLNGLVTPVSNGRTAKKVKK